MIAILQHHGGFGGHVGRKRSAFHRRAGPAGFGAQESPVWRPTPPLRLGLHTPSQGQKANQQNSRHFRYS
jgi:hypothetical protein